MGVWLRVFAEGLDAARARAAVDAALADIPVGAWFAREPELEDVFVAMLRQRGTRLETGLAAGQETGAAPRLPRAGLAIEARGLTRIFGDFRAADAVSFTVPQGEIFGLLGANGAGKTTVIKLSLIHI